MKTLITFAAALGLLAAPLTPVVLAGEKPSPSAFGKELVPDQATSMTNESKAEEMEELREDDQEAPPKARRGGGGGGRGKSVRIRLDGSVDGGGDEADDGEF